MAKGKGKTRQGESNPSRPNQLNLSQQDLAKVLIAASPDALIAVSADGEVLYWSPGAEAIFGYKSAEAIGRTIYELTVPGDQTDGGIKATREALEADVAVHESLRRRKDGSLIYVDSTTKAVRDEKGNLQFIIISKKDVTQLRVLREGRVLQARFRSRRRGVRSKWAQSGITPKPGFGSKTRAQASLPTRSHSSSKSTNRLRAGELRSTRGPAWDW